MTSHRQEPRSPFDSGAKVLIAEAKIRARVNELGAQISHDYRGKEVVAICVLRGSFVFFADLVRAIEVPLSCEFMGVSSYGGSTTSSGEVKITLDLMEPVQGKHLLIIEDIVDTGLTMRYLLNTLSTRKPASIRVATLLVKPEAIQSPVELDYIGFKIGNEFVVGYGLDYAGKFRQLPYVGLLNHEN